MQVHVGSRHLATQVTAIADASGREHLVVIAKATWSIPADGQRPRPLPPEPIVMTDQYHGDPGESALRYGADVARFKPLCDVIFDASAHAPNGVPVTELLAGFELGPLLKRVRVTGPRTWQGDGADPRNYRPTAPTSWVETPLHAGLAFGGARWFDQDGQRTFETHEANPVGLGFAGPRTLRQLHGQLAPQLTYADQSLSHPLPELRPAGLGAVGRHWQPRRAYAGTYDEAWQRDVFPLLPDDHDERFNQCAPEDQQMAYPTGGERVRMVNMVRGRPEVTFALPRLTTLVRVLRSDYSQAEPQAHVDTLFFDLVNGRFSAVWRATLPIRRRIQEITRVGIGPIDPVWWEQRRMGGGCAGCSDTPPAAAVDAAQEA